MIYHVYSRKVGFWLGIVGWIAWFLLLYASCLTAFWDLLWNRKSLVGDYIFQKSNEPFGNLRSNHFQKITWYHTHNNISWLYSSLFHGIIPITWRQALKRESVTWAPLSSLILSANDPVASEHFLPMIHGPNDVETRETHVQSPWRSTNAPPAVRIVRWTTVESGVATCDGTCLCSCLVALSMHLHELQQSLTLSLSLCPNNYESTMYAVGSWKSVGCRCQVGVKGVHPMTPPCHWITSIISSINVNHLGKTCLIHQY